MRITANAARQLAAGPGLALLLVLAACEEGGTTRDVTGPEDPGRSDLAEPGDVPDGDPGDPDADAPDATDVPESRCDPARQVEPPSRDDVAYAEWGSIACLETPCLCDGTGPAAAMLVDKLLACEAVIGGYFWEMGSAVIQVMGRQDGKCIVHLRQEVEGGVSMTECRIPFPLSPWPGLATGGDTTMGDPPLTAGIEAHCAPLGSCCILEGCPEPCDASVPMCGDLPGWYSVCDQ